MSARAKWILAVICFLLVMLGIYPTPFTYERYRGMFFRVNRFTGAMQIATDQGWQPVTPSLQWEISKLDN